MKLHAFGRQTAFLAAVASAESGQLLQCSICAIVDIDDSIALQDLPLFPAAAEYGTKYNQHLSACPRCNSE